MQTGEGPVAPTSAPSQFVFSTPRTIMRWLSGESAPYPTHLRLFSIRGTNLAPDKKCSIRFMSVTHPFSLSGKV